MGPEPRSRARRVGEALHEQLASLLANEVKDPRVAGSVVMRVVMTSDLRSARVSVRLLEGGDDTERRRVLIEALGRASGMLRREVTQRLALRFAPELHFAYDDGLDNTTRIEELLSEIEAERRSR